MQSKKNIIIASVALGLIVIIGVGAWVVIAKPFQSDQSQAENSTTVDTTPTAEQLLADGKYDEAKKAFEAELAKAKAANDEQKINYYTQQLDFLSTSQGDAGTTPPTDSGSNRVIDGSEPQTFVQQ